MTMETTRTKVLIGDGILREMFNVIMRHARIITMIITAENGIECELRDISKVGPLARLPQIRRLCGTPAMVRRSLTTLACQTQKLNP